MATDKVKEQKQNIIKAAVATWTEKRSNKEYDFTTAARAMVEEAFNLGKLVGQGKAPESTEG